jgi:pyrroline-5-carboxylate reductase
MRVAILGAGSLGSAFARHLVMSQIIDPEELFLSVRSEQRAKSLKFDFPRARVIIGVDPEFIPDVLVISVKPQDFVKASQDVIPWLSYNPLIISMMGGITHFELDHRLSPCKRIIRTMPNLPCIVGEGTVGYFIPESVDKEDFGLFQMLFETTGLLVPVKNENLLDAITALSGSGPGYLAFLYQKLLSSTQDMGFDEQTSDLVLRHTLQGFLALLNHGLSAKEIEQLVTSKGGTTHAAIEVLKARKVPKNIAEAIEAAAVRAKELATPKE